LYEPKGVECGAGDGRGFALAGFPERPRIVTTNAELAMLATACAMEDIDVRGRFLWARIAGFYLVILRVTAAGGNLLVMLQCLRHTCREKMMYPRHRNLWARLYMGAFKFLRLWLHDAKVSHDLGYR